MREEVLTRDLQICYAFFFLFEIIFIPDCIPDGSRARSSENH
jgi:hypothetical protein